MLVWLVTIGEPLPIDGDDVRLYRVGMLANLLVEKNHKVIWWTSTFDHMAKIQRFNKDYDVIMNERYRIKLLHSIAYKNNISIRRIINHLGIARRFKKLAYKEEKPDIILCSLPTLELCCAAVKYGNINKVPVVLDIRDLWPDLFIDLVPSWSRWAARIFLHPMFNMVHIACSKATAIIGISKSFVEWGLCYSKRKSTNWDLDFPLGYSEKIPDNAAQIEAEKFWSGYGVNKDSNKFIVCFFGTLGHQFDIETVIEAAKILEINRINIKFVICGDGDNLDYYKNKAKECKNVVFPGWVNATQIWTLMRLSSVGLAPYCNSENFVLGMPNKPIEYLSAGLPIITSLNQGELKNLLYTNQCGITYRNGDAESLMAVLTDLYNHPGKIKIFSENAYKLFQEKFVVEKVYGQLIDHLKSIVDNSIK